MAAPQDFQFDEQDVQRRAAVAGVSIDAAQLGSVTRQVKGSLQGLSSFDLRDHKFSEPANTYDARWK